MQSTLFSGFNPNIFSQSPSKGFEARSYRRQLTFDDNSDALSQSTEASQDFQKGFSSFGRATKSAGEISFNGGCFKKLSFETSEKTDFGMSSPQEQSVSMSFMETEIDNRDRTVSFSEVNENTMIIEEDTFFNAFTQNENRNLFATRNNRDNDSPNIFDLGLAIARRHDSFEELTNNFEKAEQFESFEFADNTVPTPSLPVINNSRDPALWTITPETLVNLMQDQSKRYIVIDCRYGYEYQGGHIEGAINIETVEDLEKLLITNRALLNDDLWLNEVKQNLQGVLQNYHLIDPETVNSTSEAPIIIFHCEFSQKRGPRAFRALRELDRQLNTYPKLHYPEVYLLEGGYENFNQQVKEACTENGTYIRMIDENYKSQYAIAKEIERKSWKKGVKKTLNPKSFSQRSRTMTCIDRFFSASQ